MKGQLTSPLHIETRAEELRQGGEIAIAVARESIKIRATQTLSTGNVVLIGASLIALAYSFTLPPWRIALWVIPVILGCLTGSFVSKRALKQWRTDLDVLDIARIEKVLFIHILIRHVIMGSGVWWTGYGFDNPNIWFVTTTIAVLYTLVSLINSCTNTISYIVAAYCNLGMMALFWATKGTVGLAVTVTMLGLIFLFRKCATQLQADFVKFVAKSFENIELARNLENEKLNAVKAQHFAEEAQHKAEKANLSKSHFLAAASHDLRQPLHAIMLFASLLDKHSSIEQRNILLMHIRTAAESLNHLFSGILDLSRLDAGAIEPEMTNVYLAPLIESLSLEFSAKARQKNLAFETNNAEIAGLTDPFLLERALRNLLDNALKYTPSGHIKLSLTETDKNVCISVEDTGIGIEEQFQETIFNEFYQLGNPARNPEHGTGLGLSIVRRLCELMGHERELHSCINKGSRFSILLQPAERHHFEIRTHMGPIDFTALAGLRILIVDDDIHVRVAMEHLLQSWNCFGIIAASLEDVASIASAISEPPHALIADYRLANNQDGFDVIRTVRRYWPQIPAAIFTGDTDAHWREPVEMKNIPIFQKPVEAEQIARWLINSLVIIPATPV